MVQLLTTLGIRKHHHNWMPLNAANRSQRVRCLGCHTETTIKFA